jgi:Tfp pilus assembly protein PilF
LGEIEEKLVELANANKKYQEIIATGDKAFEAKDYKNAETAYREAAGLKPTEQYPQEQLVKISAFLADAEKLEADYAAAITVADKAFNGKDYNAAKVDYQKALALKPEEKHPSGRLAEIETLLADVAKQDQEYTDLIKSADNSLTANDLTNAKTTYEKALSIKPDEQYPKDKIAEIASKLDEQAKKEEAYATAINKRRLLKKTRT